MRDYLKIIDTEDMIKFIETFNRNYWDNGMSIREVCKKMNIPKVTLEKRILKYHLKVRTKSEALANRHHKYRLGRLIYSKKILMRNINQSKRMKEKWRHIRLLEQNAKLEQRDGDRTSQADS